MSSELRWLLSSELSQYETYRIMYLVGHFASSSVISSQCCWFTPLKPVENGACGIMLLVGYIATISSKPNSFGWLTPAERQALNPKLECS